MIGNTVIRGLIFRKSEGMIVEGILLVRETASVNRVRNGLRLSSVTAARLRFRERYGFAKRDSSNIVVILIIVIFVYFAMIGVQRIVGRKEEVSQTHRDGRASQRPRLSVGQGLEVEGL